MHALGISIYPEHSTPERDDAYMQLASKYGYTRIFTCLLSVDKPADAIVEEFGSFVSRAHELGFTVAADTNPEVFKHLGARFDDLSIFHEMGLDIIRLDGHFGDVEDRALTRNPYGIKIEFNGSSAVNLGDLILQGADKANMLVCHNFYPQRYTGLSRQTFDRFNRQWQRLGLHTAAFISSNEPETFGPWPVRAGLPTLEEDRGLPVDVQARHLIATGAIDDILFGNAYASEEELAAVASIDMSVTSIAVDTVPEATEAEKRFLSDQMHVGRADTSDLLLRSAISRVLYKKAGGSIPYRQVADSHFHRGDVVIVNDNLLHYRGEVEIVLRDLPVDGERTLLGRIPQEEMMILDRMEENPDHFWKFIVR